MGCSIGTQTPFARAAAAAASSLSAAATTLRFAHDGRLTFEYGKTTFEILEESLDGIDKDLPRLAGSPGQNEVEHLLLLYRTATPAMSDPCLDESCEWHVQLDALDAASDAFDRAAGG